MKVHRFKRLSAVVAVAAAAAVVLTGCGGGSTDSASSSGSGDGKSLNVWWYESSDSAMGIAWNKALEEFKAAHPDVTVNFELKSWDQIQQSGSMVLNSDSTPDVMEYAKGSATAGLVAKSGLLTDLSEQATARGWDTKLPASVQTVGRYDDRGVMGTGPLYGIPTYGEYVTVFYNKDLFDKYGLKVPTTMAEFESVMDAFVAKGVTPLAESAADYPAGHLLYQLALTKADRQWIDDFQLYKGPVDFHDTAWTYAAQTMADWAKKGYYSTDSTGVKATDMGNAFTSGENPMMVSGSWWDGQLATGIKNFQWGEFLWPGNTYNAGSGGNIWIVPSSAKNKDLAYDFIDRTLQDSNQNLLGNSGGVPVAADPAAVTNPVGRTATGNFQAIGAADGLAYYPDWPAPGYYDVILKNTQELISGNLTPQEFLDAIAGPYQEYVSTLSQ